jgi:hypothetical protein
MPVHIFTPSTEEHDLRDIASFCGDEWEISPQIAALSDWLAHSSQTLQPAEYIADVSFGWRRDAATGGPVLEPAAMRRMAELGMSLQFSEFGAFADEMK